MSLPKKSPKQAVVLIHGIGEQVPMDTLRGFVKTVWETDPSLRFKDVPGTAWSKPDHISRNFELRRMTTTKNRDEVRSDFFEFYWAHLMQDTTLSQVYSWVKVLLLRSPATVPPQLRPLWRVLVGGLAVVGGCWAAYALGATSSWPGWLTFGMGLLVHGLWFVIAGFLVKYAGDAARYLRVAAANVESRHAIREAGLALLKSLHEAREDDGQTPTYGRIIMVGHSLGTVIGYDILTHCWPLYHEKINASGGGQPVPTAALDALEELAREAAAATAQKPLPQDFTERYQAAQSAYFQELTIRGCGWRVTDFVTMGSPLAHGEFLLSRKSEEFIMKKETREFPTCPPVLEEVDVGDGQPKQKKFSFRPKLWIPHHAAVFAPTRWTNLYFPCKRVVVGDPIAGPVAPGFGPGVRDIPVTTTIWNGLVSHNFYWDFPPGWNFDKNPPDPAPAWIQSLREAVRISEKKSNAVPAPSSDAPPVAAA